MIKIAVTGVAQLFIVAECKNTKNNVNLFARHVHMAHLTNDAVTAIFKSNKKLPFYCNFANKAF